MPIITGFSDDSGLPGDNLTNDSTLTLTGTSDPNTTVSIYANEVLLGTTTADASGNWTFTTSALADGTYSFIAAVGEGANEVRSAPFAITVDSVPPALEITSATQVDSGVLIEGTSDPGGVVEIYEDGTLLGTATANSSGLWQYLDAGDGAGTVTYTANSTDAAGNSAQSTIVYTRPAVIGEPTDAEVTEDESTPTLTATGSIAISDPDTGEAAFRTTVTGAPGNLGSLTLAADGSYTYSVANAAVQHLGAGQSHVDSFTVESLDGTQKTVSFTIHGTNDAAVIGEPTDAEVTEDESTPTLTATGTIAISDPDTGEAAFRTTVTGAPGNLGSLTLAADGSYSYTVANAAVQHLGAGQSHVDSFTVESLDGTQKTVSFTIHGVDESSGVPIVFETAVASGSDDAEERDSGSVSLTSTDLDLIYDGSQTKHQIVGVRFTGIDIPQGADIVAAYIQFQVDEVSTGPVTLTIYGEDSDDAATFTTASRDISSRPTTTASVVWTPGDWTVIGQAGLAQRTADLSAIVEEVVGRSGWAAFNDLAFIITNSPSGSGNRVAEAFEGAAAPILHIEYVLPDTGNLAPVLDLDASAAGTGFAAVFTENGAAVPVVDVDVLITDDDDANMERATIRLANPDINDRLVVNVAGLPAGISVAPGSTATEITLIGSASKADYQIALRQVLFENTGELPGPTARTVEVVVGDGSAFSNTALTTIAIDRAPDAAGDSVATQQDTAVTTGNVLANDDQGDAPASITAFDAASVQGGSVVNNGNGTFTYTPPAGFTGADSFTYRIADSDGDTSTATVAVTVSSGGGNSTPTVAAITNLAAQGIPDPSGLAFYPATGKLFLSDAEIDESPTFDLADMFIFDLDGTRNSSFTPPYTDEPTGLALDPIQNLLFVSDDDLKKIFVVDPDNPTTVLWGFSTSGLGATDPEDVAVNPANGRLFIVSGLNRLIVETDYAGSQVFSSILLPSEISDPEALAYDPVAGVFYVGGGFSYKIWVVDRDGTILDTIDLLKDYRNPISDTRVHVKDLEFAPASDGSGETHLYVADFGNSHVMDGRLIEIDLGDGVAAPLVASIEIVDDSLS